MSFITRFKAIFVKPGKTEIKKLEPMRFPDTTHSVVRVKSTQVTDTKPIHRDRHIFTQDAPVDAPVDLDLATTLGVLAFVTTSQPNPPEPEPDHHYQEPAEPTPTRYETPEPSQPSHPSSWGEDSHSASSWGESSSSSSSSSSDWGDSSSSSSSDCGGGSSD